MQWSKYGPYTEKKKKELNKNYFEKTQILDLLDKALNQLS